MAKFTANQAFRAEIKCFEDNDCWPESYLIDIATDADTFYRHPGLKLVYLFVRDCGTHLLTNAELLDPKEECPVDFVLGVLNTWPNTKVFKLELGDGENGSARRCDLEPWFRRVK